MSAKLVQVRRIGDSTWLTIPGNSADLNITKNSIDDSVFGSVFVSNFPTLKEWTASSSAMFKGFAGYKASIKRAGTPTAVTTVALDEEVNGGFYTSNRAQSLWDRSAVVTIYDDATPVPEADIAYIDYLQGGVVFASGATITGPITADFSYLGTAPVCFFTSFDLGQTLSAENVTDYCEANDNGGWAVYAPQQLEVDLSLDGFYSDSSDSFADIVADDEILIELDLVGDGSVVARGYFRASDLSESGDVGATETTSQSFVLAVPEGVVRPFSYYIAEDSALPAAVQVLLEAWEDREAVEFLYKPDGTEVVSQGEAWVSDASLSNSVEDMSQFSFSFQGNGALTRS